MRNFPYFDGAELPIDTVPVEDGGPTDEQIEAALVAFQSLTPEDREADTRHVHAYYLGFRNAIGGDEGLNSDMTAPAHPVDIWQYVHPEIVTVTTGGGVDDNIYVIIHAACDWEPEHGLQMVWRDGAELVRVSGIDGHPLNSTFQGRDVIYADPIRVFTTRRSEGG
ncbi:MAG: DUF6985 domain-containing protein [Tropicimonas sp.]|uniref:DUF6985 domain-containing protein n=1 Tax=Tropicimonas sp. TaxID=2067044 RepID=UPI003A8980F2